MKKLLRLSKMLLVAVGLLAGVNEAWAQTTVTYDFTSYTARTLAKSATSGFRANSIDHYYASNLDEVHNRFGFQFAGKIFIEEDGLYAQREKGDHVGIMGLASGDKVTINFSAGAIMVRGDITNWTANTSAWTSYTTGTVIPINAAGNLSFQAKSLCKISSIVITTNATETMTAPAISSEANGSARTVTITSGASSLLSPVITYYTTDGSEPTANSTEYTAPFDVNATCTVKAITISNSSAATASTVTSHLVDLDVVDVPTATITAVDGINRTVTFSCATVGATLYYSTDNGETYTEGNSLVISANTDIKVKATKGSKSAESENMSFEAGTAITLNSPNWTKTGYSEGVSTVTLADDQSNKLLSPTSTIKYQINDGAEQTYTVAISVNDGETLKYWSVATGYTNSAVGSVVAAAPNAYPTVISENFVGTVSANNNLSLADGEGYRSIYYNSGADLVSENLLASNINTGNNYMMYRAGGLYPAAGWNLAIPNLKKGDYITLNGAYGNGAYQITGGDNMTADAWNSTAGSKYCYTVDADGQVTFTMARYGYLTSITIQRAPETVSATISDAGWATLYTGKALDFSGVTGLTAYTATCDGSTVTLTKVDNVPAETGVVLKAAEGTYYVPVAASSTTDKGDLRGSLTEDIDYDQFDEYDFYVLGINGDGQAQFQQAASGTLPAGKAYLLVAQELEAPVLNVVIADSETTGIGASLMNNEQRINNNAVYNLNGQRVALSTSSSSGCLQGKKGLYIINGKKVVVK